MCSMLNLTENETTVHKSLKTFLAFKLSDVFIILINVKLSTIVFIMLINVKMSTIVGIFNIYEHDKFHYQLS